MRSISRARFDALAAHTRRAAVFAMAQEIAWFDADDGRVIATIIADTDGEFSGAILARDLLERFRWIDHTSYYDTPEEAIAELHQKLLEIVPNIDELRIQGDETGKPADFFTPISSTEKLHPSFRTLTSEKAYTAARRMIDSMMRWHEDVDGNFVQQFQTDGFDARLWELYLFAVLAEANLDVMHPKPAPDFLAQSLGGEFAMEATTIGLSGGKNAEATTPQAPRNEEEYLQYMHHYLPIKYAGPLTKKLGKGYWKRASAIDKPLVFAIQDFHAPMSMTYSGHALPVYLYGYTHEAITKDGKLKIVPTKITEHKWGKKIVPSGFFSLPDAKHVSAVIFNSSGTISKFNRMGVAAGFGSDDVVLVHRGQRWNQDSNASTPTSFLAVVTEGYPETWIEGMDVFHNPNALHPLAPELLPGAAHHRLMADGNIETIGPDWKPIRSTTSNVTFSGPQQEESLPNA
ncbi:hypothetical protein ACIA5G_05945 [Amycolatopsis sp. NPDC051758]|uniref:hypothetical protein n=1 Tax=Amycolatopsis sp. NPDC051758 TaxID=3363935 RepID=UPI0037A2CDF3